MLWCRVFTNQYQYICILCNLGSTKLKYFMINALYMCIICSNCVNLRPCWSPLCYNVCVYIIHMLNFDPGADKPPVCGDGGCEGEGGHLPGPVGTSRQVWMMIVNVDNKQLGVNNNHKITMPILFLYVFFIKTFVINFKNKYLFWNPS